MPRFENFDAKAEADSVITTPEIPDLTDEQRIVKAVAVAMEYGQFDGDHHKQWALNQVVRILAGNEYNSVIAAFENGEDGPQTYEWDTGIAP